MGIESDSLRALVVRVSRGDRSAEVGLIQRLEQPVERMVRQVLQGGGRPLAFARMVHDEAQRLGGQETSDLIALDSLAERIARRICTSLVELLRAETSSWETFRDMIRT